MPNPDNQKQTQTTPGETHYEKEPKGHEGTMGGQPPLNVKAGIQSTGRGGVLVEKGQVKKDKPD